MLDPVVRVRFHIIVLLASRGIHSIKVSSYSSACKHTASTQAEEVNHAKDKRAESKINSGHTAMIKIGRVIAIPRRLDKEKREKQQQL